MKILVIGNGFDLEHGLPTKYGDFLDFIKMIRMISDNRFENQKDEFENLLNNFNDNVSEYLISNEVFYQESRKDIVKELMELVKKNVWIEYFEDQKDYKNKGWIDFESEISLVIKSLDCMKKSRNNYSMYKEQNKEMEITEQVEGKIINLIGNSFSNLNDEYFEKIIEPLEKDLNNIIRCLEIYLEECVGEINIKYRAPDIEGIKFDKVLSFNYTSIYSKIYGLNNNSIEYDYIHGISDITHKPDENNMVLGIDEYLDAEARNNEVDFITFKKYFQRIYKQTGCEYREWIEEISADDNNKKHEIYIFGHSLDVTDKDILKELIGSWNTITTIFYYDKKVYAKQIANLVKLIGQDKLTDSVYSPDETIIFKQQQQRIEIE